VIDEPGLDIAPSSVLATAGFPAKILATAIVRGGESGVVYAYTLTPKNNAPARLELDSGGGAVRSVTPFLLAEVGTHEYRINANQNGGTLAFTANLTVAVSTTPALILELTETEVRIPEGTPAGIISAVRAATGGLGSGYTYSLDTGSLPSGILGINAAGEVRLSAAAAVASGGNGPHENVEVIAASGELRTTMTLLYSVWGAELLRSGAEVRDRRDVAGSTLPDINIRNERGRNYNYAAERIGGGEAPSISADGEIIAPGGGFVLPDPRARTTLTLRLTATDTNTSGGAATVTAEIIVRPRVLGIAYTRVVAPKLGDQPGVIIGRLVASDGEGLVADYQFSHDGTFPLSLDMQGATARIILAAEITAAIPQIQRGFTVELGGESADTSQLLFASDRITLSVAPILLTTGDTGMVATATIINRAPEPLSDYDFSLNDSASFGGFGNFSIDSASGVLRVSPGIAQAERGEIEVRAVYPEARRTLVAMVQVSVVAPIQLNVVPDTATVTALAQDNSIIVQANAAGGSGGYDYSFGTAPSAPPANIGIDGSSGAITLLSPFSVPGEHSFEVVVLDNESRRATETAIITVAPAPLELQAAETAFSVRITATSGEFITLGVVGGRSPYLYSLDGEPAGLLIDEDRIIHHQSAFLAAGEFPFRAIVTDADSESATVHLTLTVFLNPEVNIAPASVQITAGVTSTVLAAASIDNGGAGVSYTYSVLPVAGAPGGRLQVDGGGGNINLTSHYLTVEANTHQYNVEATGGGETFTATLTVLVIAPPPLIIDLAPTFFRVGAGGTPAGVVARATGTGGIGGYTYRFSQIPGDISGLLGIDSNNGEIRLLADGDFVRTNSGGIRTIDTPAMVEVASGGELRTRARFDFSIWGVNLLNPNIEVRNGDEYRFNSGSSRFGFSLHNGRNGGTVAYTCSATRSDGKATAIFRCGESSAVVQFRTPDLFTLPDPRVRATVTINLSMTERQAPFSVARATGFFTVRPDELNFSTGDKITNPAVGEGAGIVVAKLRATRGEGPIDGYQFTYSGSLPLSLDVQEDSADVILNGVLSAEAADSVHTFTVVQGPETRTQELSFAVGPGITLSVAAVLLTMGDTVPVATAAIINLPASDETGDYDFSLTDSASFAGFGNFSIAENGGILQVDTAFSAATTGEIEVRAVYPEARRTLVATVQINVVEPLVLEVSPASVIIAADVAAGNVAAASATGGEGAYTYSLENIPPEQLQIIPASGEIRVTAGFPDPGEIT
ncbi:MAG: hypothetical protein HAW59_00005, partial [Betaproteobacteria bacterium]|nr:hypothetical protein [Betaproteobacteria bacterium]